MPRGGAIALLSVYSKLTVRGVFWFISFWNQLYLNSMGFEQTLSISRTPVQTPTLTPPVSVLSLPSCLSLVIITIQYIHAY